MFIYIMIMLLENDPYVVLPKLKLRSYNIPTFARRKVAERDSAVVSAQADPDWRETATAASLVATPAAARE